MADKTIKKYDKNNNLIYQKNSNGYEYWRKYDENNYVIYGKNTDGYEFWREYDENNNLIYRKNSGGFEIWSKYDEDNNEIKITEKEYKEIKYRAKEKEYLSRTKCSRFELMEI